MERAGILERKAIIKNADMTEDMQQDAIECATQVWPANTSAFSTDCACLLATFVSVRNLCTSVVFFFSFPMSSRVHPVSLHVDRIPLGVQIFLFWFALRHTVGFV